MRVTPVSWSGPTPTACLGGVAGSRGGSVRSVRRTAPRRVRVRGAGRAPQPGGPGAQGQQGTRPASRPPDPAANEPGRPIALDLAAALPTCTTGPRASRVASIAGGLHPRHLPLLNSRTGFVPRSHLALPDRQLVGETERREASASRMCSLSSAGIRPRPIVSAHRLSDDDQPRPRTLFPNGPRRLRPLWCLRWPPPTGTRDARR
jgi:hypothetical protein